MHQLNVDELIPKMEFDEIPLDNDPICLPVEHPLVADFDAIIVKRPPRSCRWCKIFLIFSLIKLVFLSIFLHYYGVQVQCGMCISSAYIAGHVAKIDSTESGIVGFAKWFCARFSEEPRNVCDGLVEQFRGEFFYVLRQLSDDPYRICSAAIKECRDEGDPIGEGWMVDLPPTPRYQRSIDSTQSTTAPCDIESHSSSCLPNRYLRVLQIADIHVDFFYDFGSEADCQGSVCCRWPNKTNSREGSVRKIKQRAGYWGSIAKCDIPYRTLEHMLRHIKENEKIDYIMMSGDLLDHFDWEYSVKHHAEGIRNITTTFKDIFPSTPVYWAIGNHEGNPVNSFAPRTSAPQAFWPTDAYGRLVNMNKPWIKEDEYQNGNPSGSWSTLITPGLRLISINTGFCITTNFFLYLNQSDPEGTMSWFAAQLHKAEIKGENVHVMAHIPPGYTDCLEGWSRNYYRIVQRFHKTITGQFFGHVHYDYFTVFYADMNDIRSEPISVAYASPSTTTFDYLNPAHRIYTIDRQNEFAITDFDSFYADLTQTSEQTPPDWKLLYSPREQYGMRDLSPQSWNDVINDILNNKTRKEEFLRLSYRTPNPHCNHACQRGLLCLLRSGHHNDTLYCPHEKN